MAKNTNWKRYSHDHHVRNNNYNAQTVPPVNVTWKYEVEILTVDSKQLHTFSTKKQLQRFINELKDAFKNVGWTLRIRLPTKSKPVDKKINDSFFIRMCVRCPDTEFPYHPTMSNANKANNVTLTRPHGDSASIRWSSPIYNDTQDYIASSGDWISHT
tara:strand:+ start:813 stop:1286 length:474 start_codon:yes stop_codon:yes gene_type:complete